MERWRKNGIATMGTALTEEHCAILKRQAEEVIVCYDGDDAGQAAAFKSIPMLESAGLKVSVAMLPKGKDPDDYISEYGPEYFLREIMDQPVSVTKFKLIYSRKNHILLKEEGRKNYLLEAVQIVAELDSSTEREVYLKEISREFEISLDALKQDCHQIRQELQKRNRKGIITTIRGIMVGMKSPESLDHLLLCLLSHMQNEGCCTL